MSLAEELLTGIHEIDEQHQTLLDILEKLQKLVEGKDNWSVIYFALTELTNYTRTHFVVEEALMRLHGYPDLEEHISEHRRFTERMAQLEEQAVRHDVTMSIIEFLQQWLVGHIGGSDQQYVHCLRTSPCV